MPLSNEDITKLIQTHFLKKLHYLGYVNTATYYQHNSREIIQPLQEALQADSTEALQADSTQQNENVVKKIDNIYQNTIREIQKNVTASTNQTLKTALASDHQIYATKQSEKKVVEKINEFQQKNNKTLEEFIKEHKLEAIEIESKEAVPPTNVASLLNAEDINKNLKEEEMLEKEGTVSIKLKKPEVENAEKTEEIYKKIAARLPSNEDEEHQTENREREIKKGKKVPPPLPIVQRPLKKKEKPEVESAAGRERSATIPIAETRARSDTIEIKMSKDPAPLLQANEVTTYYDALAASQNQNTALANLCKNNEAAIKAALAKLTKAQADIALGQITNAATVGDLATPFETLGINKPAAAASDDEKRKNLQNQFSVLIHKQFLDDDAINRSPIPDLLKTLFKNNKDAIIQKIVENKIPLDVKQPIDSAAINAIQLNDIPKEIFKTARQQTTQDDLTKEINKISSKPLDFKTDENRKLLRETLEDNRKNKLDNELIKDLDELITKQKLKTTTPGEKNTLQQYIDIAKNVTIEQLVHRGNYERFLSDASIESIAYSYGKNANPTDNDYDSIKKLNEQAWKIKEQLEICNTINKAFATSTKLSDEEKIEKKRLVTEGSKLVAQADKVIALTDTILKNHSLPKSYQHFAQNTIFAGIQEDKRCEVKILSSIEKSTKEDTDEKNKGADEYNISQVFGASSSALTEPPTASLTTTNASLATYQNTELGTHFQPIQITTTVKTHSITANIVHRPPDDHNMLRTDFTLSDDDIKTMKKDPEHAYLQAKQLIEGYRARMQACGLNQPIHIRFNEECPIFNIMAQLYCDEMYNKSKLNDKSYILETTGTASYYDHWYRSNFTKECESHREEFNKFAKTDKLYSAAAEQNMETEVNTIDADIKKLPRP